MSIAAASHAGAAKAVALELCLSTDDCNRLQHNVLQAAELGVSRLELCSAMQQDGLSPALADVALARRYWGARPGVMAMLRPRGGDFCYSPAEISALLTLLPALADAGADAVVCGVLQQRPDGQQHLHWQALAELSDCARSYGLTFCLHRAVDAVSDPLHSWQQLCHRPQLQVARALSSGCRWRASAAPAVADLPGGGMAEAVRGVAQLAQQLALGGPELVVAGGVSATNLAWLRQQLLQAAPGQTNHSGPLVPRFSFHLHSAVLQDGWVDPVLLSAVLAQCHSPAA